MLRALENKPPSQVAEAKQNWLVVAEASSPSVELVIMLFIRRSGKSETIKPP